MAIIIKTNIKSHNYSQMAKVFSLLTQKYPIVDFYTNNLNHVDSSYTLIFIDPDKLLKDLKKFGQEIENYLSDRCPSLMLELPEEKALALIEMENGQLLGLSDCLKKKAVPSESPVSIEWIYQSLTVAQINITNRFDSYIQSYANQLKNDNKFKTKPVYGPLGYESPYIDEPIFRQQQILFTAIQEELIQQRIFAINIIWLAWQKFIDNSYTQSITSYIWQSPYTTNTIPTGAVTMVSITIAAPLFLSKLGEQINDVNITNFSIIKTQLETLFKQMDIPINSFKVACDSNDNDQDNTVRITFEKNIFEEQRAGVEGGVQFAMLVAGLVDYKITSITYDVAPQLENQNSAATEEPYQLNDYAVVQLRS